MTRAFHFSAIDYLLKPVEVDLLADAVRRTIRNIEQKNGNVPIKTLVSNIENLDQKKKLKLCIPSMKGFQVVNITDILYSTADGNYTTFHFISGQPICSSRPIHEYEKILEDSNFVRVHKSYMGNLEHVREYVKGEGGHVVLSNGQEIMVSRRRKEELMQRMKQYFKF